MIFYFTRLAHIFLRESRRPRISPLDTVIQRRRALPWDCDNNLHINNGRYLWLMDFGRTAWIARVGLRDAILREKIHFVVGSSVATFRRSVDLWEAYTLETRLVGDDGRWFFFEQIFRKADGSVAVRAMVRGMARRGGQTLPPADLLALAGHSVEPGPLPEEVHQWVASSEATLDWIRGHDEGPDPAAHPAVF